MRRATLLRRVAGDSHADKQMAKEIYQMYEMQNEPGIYKDDISLSQKTQAGEPMSRERARLRKQCNPRGPIGFLLETAHLQASSIDCNFVIHQWNQPSISILDAPYQHLRPLLRQAAARNRTKAAEGTRTENVGLSEIDMFATKAEGTKLREEERNRLNIIRTGSTWTNQSTFWTGKTDESLFKLC